MKYFLLFVLCGCSMFHDDESITIHKPEIGQTIEITTEPTIK